MLDLHPQPRGELCSSTVQPVRGCAWKLWMLCNHSFDGFGKTRRHEVLVPRCYQSPRTIARFDAGPGALCLGKQHRRSVWPEFAAALLMGTKRPVDDGVL